MSEQNNITNKSVKMYYSKEQTIKKNRMLPPVVGY